MDKFFKHCSIVMINLPRAERNCAIGQRLCHRRRSQSAGATCITKSPETGRDLHNKTAALTCKSIAVGGSPSVRLPSVFRIGRPANELNGAEWKRWKRWLLISAAVAFSQRANSRHVKSGERKFAAAWPWLQVSWCVYVFLKAILASQRRPSIHPTVRLDSLGAGSVFALMCPRQLAFLPPTK